MGIGSRSAGDPLRRAGERADRGQRGLRPRPREAAKRRNPGLCDLNPFGVPRIRNPNGVASIPHVPLVKFNFMFRQQPAQFVLKRHPAMMLVLSGNVILDNRTLRLAYRKPAVSGLPME
jgi:hypothetical protein